jgi:hypothetical protein
MATWEEKGWGDQFCNHIFLGSINLYNNVGETQQKFIGDLVLYICKGYMPPLMCFPYG